MIVHDCVQGSPAWEALRIGRPTSSQFHRIYSPVRRKPSRQRDLYLQQLVHEFAQGRREEQFESKWTKRGQELEDRARFDYEMQYGVAVRRVGFVTRDDGLCGGSPDGLIGDEEILEVKIPSPQIQLAIIDGKDPGHIAQCQGLLYVCERKVTKLFCYGDRHESVLKEIPRDDEWIGEFEVVLNDFIRDLEEEKAAVRHAYQQAAFV